MSDNFKKTLAQVEATKILSSDARHVCLSGGSRSGKSLLLMRSMIIRAAKVKSKHCVFRLNFNHVKRSIVLETFPKVMSLCFPNLKYELNKTDYIATLPNNSQIFFAGLDTGERVEKILGQEFSSLWFNEISQIPYSSVQMALSRLAEKNDLTKKVYYDMNPGTKASWPYLLFVKKLDPIDSEPIKNPDDYAIFKMNPESNLENLDNEYLDLLASMPEKERNRFLLGEFNDESNGQAYYSFREEHVAETKIIPGTILIPMDYNLNPFCALVAQYYDNKFHIHDEVYLENADTYRMADELKKRGLSGAKIIPDSTANNRRTSGKSDIQILREAGFDVMSTHNPYQLDRVNNLNRLLTANRVVINPKCRKLINDLHRVVWKDNKLDQTGANKMLTHASDCLGYLTWKLEPITSSIKMQITQQTIR